MQPIAEEGEEDANSGAFEPKKFVSPQSKGPPKPQIIKHQLSVASTHYDIGNKGFLTPAEQRMRQLDTRGSGHLSNEQVADIIEETIKLRNVNHKLRIWLIALFAVVIGLGLSNLGTAFAAAKLAKEVSVDDNDGQMTVKGSNVPIVTQSTGRPQVVRALQTAQGIQVICLRASEVGSIWNSTVSGTPNVLVVEEDENSAESLGLTSTQTSYNATHSCMGVRDGRQLCFEFADTICDDLNASGTLGEEARDTATGRNAGRDLRSLEHRRRLFHASRRDDQRSLQLLDSSGARSGSGSIFFGGFITAE